MAMMDMPGEFTDERFWDKVKHFALAAGREVIEKALWLYYAFQKPETPAWAKAVIAGALAYFILPVDAIPDAIPVVGYTDDLGALASALGMVAMHISADVKQQASQKLNDWFGSSGKVT
jgi:uncharacterized membrane protein YkvA (DUF1232 family)